MVGEMLDPVVVRGEAGIDVLRLRSLDIVKSS
jgi:hypothetical protein